MQPEEGEARVIVEVILTPESLRDIKIAQSDYRTEVKRAIDAGYYEVISVEET